jgi:DNA polymerase-3 subunit gamma/tau
MLLKALEEVAMAPNAMMAAERWSFHVADLPSVEDLKFASSTKRPRRPAVQAVVATRSACHEHGRSILSSDGDPFQP